MCKLGQRTHCSAACSAVIFHAVGFARHSRNPTINFFMVANAIMGVKNDILGKCHQGGHYQSVGADVIPENTEKECLNIISI